MDWKPQITYQEQLLARALRLEGIACLSNHKICGYYPDLWVKNTNILIEIDGSVHRSKEAKQRDKQRTAHLNLAGYRVLRFGNRQVETSLLKVIKQVKKAIAVSETGRTGFMLKNQSIHQKTS